MNFKVPEAPCLRQPKVWFAHRPIVICIVDYNNRVCQLQMLRTQLESTQSRFLPLAVELICGAVLPHRQTIEHLVQLDDLHIVVVNEQLVRQDH